MKLPYTSYHFRAALFGAALTLIALPPTVAHAHWRLNKEVTICHRPGTPSEETRDVSIYSLVRHLRHGDRVGTCADDEQECPCGSATALHALFLREDFSGEPGSDHCVDEGRITELVRVDSGAAPEGPVLSLSAIEESDESAAQCFYSVVDANQQTVAQEAVFDLTPGEVEACREDIREVMAGLDDC